jgi:NNP family nitrate/nitrite transporter-like MFS transporter
VASLAILEAGSFATLLVCAGAIGLAGNSFAAGIAWNSAWFPRHRQGVALGTFGAGNVGASVTKLFGPGLMAAAPAALGWRIVPLAYAVLLLVLAAVVWWWAPLDVPALSQDRSLTSMLSPLRIARVWRFGLYYVVVFGAYVAFSLTLPKYYMTCYGLSLAAAGLLTSLFIFPASLLRPLGGHLSDRVGPRAVMYGVFSTILVCCGALAVDGLAGLRVGVIAFTGLVVVIGVAMGLGKAAVYKYIPEYFPKDIAAVGGLVGTLGALGGFFLPLFFGYLRAWSGLQQIPFLVLLALTAGSLSWLHLVARGKVLQVAPS